MTTPNIPTIDDDQRASVTVEIPLSMLDEIRGHLLDSAAFAEEGGPVHPWRARRDRAMELHAKLLELGAQALELSARGS